MSSFVSLADDLEEGTRLRLTQAVPGLDARPGATFTYTGRYHGGEPTFTDSGNSQVGIPECYLTNRHFARV